jgi:hypothetical protein
MSLHIRKKRKKELRDEYIEQDALIFQLPDETFLYLFQYLSTEELILVAGFVHQTILSFLFHIFSSLVFVNYFVVLLRMINYGKESI